MFSLFSNVQFKCTLIFTFSQSIWLIIHETACHIFNDNSIWRPLIGLNVMYSISTKTFPSSSRGCNFLYTIYYLIWLTGSRVCYSRSKCSIYNANKIIFYFTLLTNKLHCKTPILYIIMMHHRYDTYMKIKGGFRGGVHGVWTPHPPFFPKFL